METIIANLNHVLERVLIVLLLSTGLWLTIRLGFIQFRRFRHGLLVVSGKYDAPEASGDYSHFQALTTALSATVGIGNIAGVAIAIHWGGPGAIFWMWITALLGMATKFTEVTLAQKFRVPSTNKTGSTSGGPMYYIEQGLGKKWKPMAIFFAFALMIMAFISGNAVQANTLADLVQTVFGVPAWITGALSASVVGFVLIGGISRIGKVTSILAPSMAALYVLGGLIVLFFNAQEIVPSLRLIVSEAFNPTAGVAGTGAGIFMQTLIWGIRRGLFSNEAGQGSAPIAHSAAKTEEPVSEGAVAILEPFIDTILICSITALVILTTGVWKQTTPTPIVLNSGDLSYYSLTAGAAVDQTPGQIHFAEGRPVSDTTLAWHEVPVTTFYTDAGMTQLFDGTILPAQQMARTGGGQAFSTLHGAAVENAAPLTMWGYREVLGNWGVLIVVLCVILFAVSTAISWSYYGDRCVTYVFGDKAILPYRIIYVGMHFVGAILGLNVVWALGDLAMSLGTIPNVIALVLLSGTARALARKYFQDKPYLKNNK